MFRLRPMRAALMAFGPALLALALVATSSAAPSITPGEPPIAQKYRERIPQLMEEQNIPGLALAVVDESGVIWAEGFGHTDTDRRVPVTPDTIFSIQSTSKTFTALAVLLAVQDGLVDLDAPITTYLPDFTVHSIFEEHPERQITLRHLLSHTAGFTHEAPVGNNWDADANSFEAHIRSIADTWLRFPVGKGYAYSNLGIDLAGYLLQTVTGQPFADYERDQVFQPLGMAYSSFDMAAIRAQPNRALGHAGPAPSVLAAVPMVPAGGMYSSANDLARFIQFQLNGGVVDGQRLLSAALLDEMLTVQFPVHGQREGYALGLARTGWFKGRNADLFSHGGGGFGFLSDLWWLPELKLGIAVLTNSSDHKLQGSLALQILDEMVHQPGPFYDRLTALPYKSAVTEGNSQWRPPATLAADIAACALPPNPAGWQSYLGDYKSPNWNVLNPFSSPSRVYEHDGALYFNGSDVGDPTQLRLFETAPGLFFTETGQALDFRAMPPTYRNIPLVRVGSGPSPLAWGVLAACGLVMLSALLAQPARPIWRRLRRRSGGNVQPPGPGGAVAAAASGLAVAGSLFGMASIGLLAAIPQLVYSGFLGWLNLPIGPKLLAHAPLGLAVCAVALAVVAVPAWRRGWWSKGSVGTTPRWSSWRWPRRRCLPPGA